jgi:hypothetical protein
VRVEIGPDAFGDSAVATIDHEHWVLTTDAGRALLAAVAAVRSIGPADLSRFRRLASPERVSAAIRLVQSRRKAAEKFDRGERMWVNPTGVEQATSEPVARHKAVRFASCSVVVDLCAGIGGDALALAERSQVLAVDLDPGMGRRIQWNAAVYGVADRILAVGACAESFSIPSGAWLHLDPDRRAGRTQRAFLLDDYSPGPPFWDAIRQRAAAGAIKLSPASDFARHFPLDSGYEIELISHRGECKEATAWFGALASCRRRATRLPENVTWADGDGEPDAPAPIATLGSWIYDPDPSLIRAGLLDGFARVHGLARVAAGVDYLTGDKLISTPFLAAFAVQDVSALDLKRLRRMIAVHQVGELEIKVRGVKIAPEVLHAQLKPSGAEAATLLIIGGAKPTRAVLARRGL